MKNINYILFDAANTLIHKPQLWTNISAVLAGYGYNIPEQQLQHNHKLLSEVINFPDRTSKEFYKTFNSELLLSFGILPDEAILDELFHKCSYLPWEKFDDTDWLADCPVPMGILSNFHGKLHDLLKGLFGNIFANIIVSEDLQVRKPDVRFFRHVLDVVPLPPEQILYIGDSVKLDVAPALSIGFNVLLIDRLQMYRHSPYTIGNLSEIKKYTAQ